MNGLLGFKTHAFRIIIFQRTTAKTTAMMRNLVNLFLTFLLCLPLAECTDLNLEFPLSIESDNGCPYLIKRHKFSGSCCSLQTTGNDGCVLIVINGNCAVSRRIIWLLTAFLFVFWYFEYKNKTHHVCIVLCLGGGKRMES